MLLKVRDEIRAMLSEEVVCTGCQSQAPQGSARVGQSKAPVPPLRMPGKKAAPPPAISTNHHGSYGAPGTYGADPVVRTSDANGPSSAHYNPSTGIAYSSNFSQPTPVRPVPSHARETISGSALIAEGLLTGEAHRSSRVIPGSASSTGSTDQWASLENELQAISTSIK
jgi:hypothetical protein